LAVATRRRQSVYAGLLGFFGFGFASSVAVAVAAL
jgi:hypothetical protein